MRRTYIIYEMLKIPIKIYLEKNSEYKARIANKFWNAILNCFLMIFLFYMHFFEFLHF